MNVDKLVEIIKGNVSLNNFLGMSKAYRKVVLALSKNEILRNPDKFVSIGLLFDGRVIYEDDSKEFLALVTTWKDLFNILGSVTETAEKEGLQETVNVLIKFLTAFANNLEALGCPAEDLTDTKAQVDAIIDMMTKLKNVAPELVVELATVPKLISQNIDLDKELQNYNSNEYYNVINVIINAMKASGFESSSSPKVKAIVDRIVATGVIDAATLNAMIDEFLGNTAE